MNQSRYLIAGLVAAGITAQAADYTLHSFKKIQLEKHFWAEGAGCADFNHDGKMDVVAGPFWYEGGDFQKRHEYRTATKTSKLKKADGTEETIPGYKGSLGNENDYSDNFITFVYDFNGDGWPDIFICGLPGKEVSWYENPKNQKAADDSELWVKHKVFDVLDNESPMFGDINGDGKPEIICNSGGFLGYVAPDWSQPTNQWKFHPISPKGKWHKYTHGVGIGDINMDGRADFLEQDGWWEQPKSLEGDPVWTFHPVPFAPAPGGAAQMYAYDFNGDGLNDVLTCLDPHRHGLVWHEQYRENGEIKFRQHVIMGKEAKDNKYGVHFTQPHAIELVDVDGDGVLDIVTGKRFWAHGPKGDVDPNAPAVLYWFKTVRGADKSVDFIPYLVDDNSGVGTQVTVGNLKGTGLPDIIVANKRGAFVFLHETKKVSKTEWEAAQPKPTP
ncbi:MAG: VCBS repeat-containing protein [Verrucomicrobiota bacterium]